MVSSPLHYWNCSLHANSAVPSPFLCFYSPFRYYSSQSVIPTLKHLLLLFFDALSSWSFYLTGCSFLGSFTDFSPSAQPINIRVLRVLFLVPFFVYLSTLLMWFHLIMWSQVLFTRRWLQKKISNSDLAYKSWLLKITAYLPSPQECLTRIPKLNLAHWNIFTPKHVPLCFSHFSKCHCHPFSCSSQVLGATFPPPLSFIEV